ncbi:hypothetical protein CDA63_19420 [Hymenobacter amundsenii]|uniref:Uncharacterized protein n=1 Tax=Hymenobacter amundsenii TaxID=2006685 RepID=A0A2D0AFP3_9BACT|nr:hypothetical protein [Hymenobacter amundsenii]OWP61437.1 hypothetical protein CDA63_19420 [Hymenobacter amundsenii]
MSASQKRDFTAKTARPVLDTSSLYGMDEVPPLPATDGAAAATEPVVAQGAEAAEQEWVQFSTYLRRSTYLRLKQAEYWEPGFVARRQIEQAVSELLDGLENANRSLPEELYQKLLLKNKKLKR